MKKLGIFKVQTLVLSLFTQNWANGKVRGSFDKPPKVQFLGKELEFEDTHKHLGVIFHKKGSWTPHITEKIRKASGVLIKLKNWMGKIWGLTPKSALWMYKAVARPMFTHGCLVWHKACEAPGIKEKLRNFQSKGLKNLGCFRRSTPRMGLEIVTYTFPLHLHIKIVAALSYLRTRGYEKFNEDDLDTVEESYVGHRFAMRRFLSPLGVDFTSTPSDDIQRQFMWHNKYTVDTYSYCPTNRKRGVPLIDSDCNIYTDGSKQDSGLSGAGVAVFKSLRQYFGDRERNSENPICDQSYHLKDSTVFQCEMYAINKAALWLLQNCDQRNIMSAVINSDSQASLKALQAKEIKSSLVKETMGNLNSVASRISLKLRWNKAHVDDHRGNNRADRLANEGADPGIGLSVDDVPKIPLSIIKSKIIQAVKSVWKNEWQYNIGTKWNHRQTKDWFPEPNPRRSFLLVKNNDRIMFSRKVHIITGHGPFTYHEDRCKPADGPGPFCDLCMDTDALQTSKHILQECEVFAHLRHVIFKDAFPDDMDNITDKMLSDFIIQSNFKWFPFDDEPEEHDPG